MLPAAVVLDILPTWSLLVLLHYTKDGTHIRALTIAVCILPRPRCPRYADTWAAYIDMERRRRNLKQARTLYKRVYTRRLEEGGQVLMCEAWLRFEREEGR